MNKRSALIALSLTAMLVACGKQEAAPSATSAAPAPAAISKIVVGLDDNFPPMGFRDEKNELVGFDIDMAREAAKRMGMEVDFKPIDWSAKEAELSAKRVDVLWNGLTITEERKKNIAFTAPYMENHQIVVVAATSPIKAKADLAGKVVGAQDGSSAVDAVKKDNLQVVQGIQDLWRQRHRADGPEHRPARRRGGGRGGGPLLRRQETAGLRCAR